MVYSASSYDAVVLPVSLVIDLKQAAFYLRGRMLQ